MRNRKKILTNEQTWNKLAIDENFQKFFKGFLKLLQNKLQKGEVIGHNYSYSYCTCGQRHDPRNPTWKPFQNLEMYCQKNGYDFFAARDLIEERIGRRLVCECELLNNEGAMRRKTLERVFGLDFGGPGGRDFDIV
jgi:hypothetical protein